MALQDRKIPTKANPFYTAPDEKKIYTGNIVSVNAFEGQGQASVLVGAKTCDGMPIKQKFLRLRIDMTLGQKLKLVTGTEIAFAVDGRSKEPVSNLPPNEARGLAGASVYAVNGLDQSSIRVTLSREIATDEEILDGEDWEDAKRATGAASRAIDALGKLFGLKDKAKAAQKNAEQLGIF
jgi:hypothetical protein